MGWIGMLFWLLPRRLRSSWLLLAITSFGILAAVTLMSVGAIYSRALAEGGLRHILASTPLSVLNAWVIVQNRPLGPSDYQKLRATVEEIAGVRLGYMLRDSQRFGRTQPNLPLTFAPEEPVPVLDSRVGRPFFLTEFEQHSRLVAGRWPEATPIHPIPSSLTPVPTSRDTPSPSEMERGPRGEGLELEAAMGNRVASPMGLKVGSQVYLIPFRNDPSERITLTIVGLVEPLDFDEEYWAGSSSAYFNVQEYNERILVPIYVPEEAFFGSLGARYPSLVGDYGWFLFFDTSVLTAAMAKPTRDAIIGLETDINKRFPRSLVLSGLKNTLADYQRHLTLARVPLFLFISLVVVVILYFLALVMGLLARTRSDEASLLRSRGASMLQVSGLLALGEGAVVLLAMVLGPLLALAIVRYLLLETINPAGAGGNPLAVGFAADMFIMGAIGGLLSLGVLLASGVGLARLGIVEFLRVRARPPTVPFLHRYYVDLLVLAAGGLAWWQIQGRGGFIEKALSDSDLQVDPSLLFGPVLALLAAAFLVLRFLPLLVRFLAWAAHLTAPAWVSFALVRVARDPLPYGSLAVILMMAMALGVFGAAFQSTLSRSQREQALYDVGGDLVVKSQSFSTSTRSEVATMPGVQSVSPLIRDSVVLLDRHLSTSTTLLAVDPGTLPDAAWFRDDFAGKGLPELLGPLRQGRSVPSDFSQDPTQGVPIPVGAERIGVWVNTDKLNWGPFQHRLSFWARLSEAGEQYRTLLLGELQPPGKGAPPYAPTESRDAASGAPTGQGWTYLEAPLAADPPSPRMGEGGTIGELAELPLRVVSIFISRSSLSRMPPGSISLDDITVKGPSTPHGGIVIEGFEEPGRWVPLAHAGPVADTVERTAQAARSEHAGLTFSWEEPLGDTPRGILIPPGPFPLPAIGGPTFYGGQEVRIRAGRGLVPVVVRDVTNYFPTVDPSSQPFLLVSLEAYRQYLQRIPGGASKSPDEFWASLDGTASRHRTALSLKERLPGFVLVRDRDAVVDLAQRNPLAGGGWNGLTILSTSTLTLAIVLTLGTHAIVSVRTGRVDLTVARVLGLSTRQLFLSLSLERIVVAVVGLAAGSAMGVWLGRWVLGFLDLTPSGRPVIPPMVLTVQGWLIALVLVNLVAAWLLALLFATLSARRLKVPDVLRTGE